VILLEYGDFNNFIISSLKCPLSLIPGLVISPRIFKEVQIESVQDESILRYLPWCDLCGLCGDNVKSYIHNFYIKNRTYYLKHFSEVLNQKFEIVESGTHYLYLDYSESIISLIPEYIKHHLKDLGQDIGLIRGPDMGIIYLLDKLGFSIDEKLKNFISNNGISSVITLDKYSNYIFTKYLKPIKHKIISITTFLSGLLERENIIMRRAPDMKVNILNSFYSYYKKELKIFKRISVTLPSIKFYLSKKMYGSGLLDVVGDEALSRAYINTLEWSINKRIKILATMDPRLYSLLYRYSERRDYIYAFLPNLILGFMSLI